MYVSTHQSVVKYLYRNEYLARHLFKGRKKFIKNKRHELFFVIFVVFCCAIGQFFTFIVWTNRKLARKSKKNLANVVRTLSCLVKYVIALCKTYYPLDAGPGRKRRVVVLYIPEARGVVS